MENRESDETKVSGFNEAQLQMMRIDKLQRMINAGRFSPFKQLRDLETGLVSYGCEISFDGINGLYSEIFERLKENENEKCLEFQKNCDEAINDLFEYNFQTWKNHGDKLQKIINDLAVYEKYFPVISLA